MEIRGYKVFNPEWTCRGKQYTCPGEFEEDVKLSVCNSGMHFCKRLIDCFQYYDFDPKNKVAEVVAFGEVLEEGNKCCTNKLRIVRELTWQKVLECVNTGSGNSGDCNSGDRNSGNWNSGNYNSGDRNSGIGNSGNWNSGDWNSGNRNSGYWNSGYCNSGNRNSGDWNSGNYNSGNRNSGDCNSGNWNSGYCNSGNRNSGDWNSGNYNSGNRNSGDRNSGIGNSGNWNSGDWNSGNYSNGCFNTTEPKIYLFNKPSNWTYRDWLNSKAQKILKQIPVRKLEYISVEKMTEKEKAEHPEAKITGGYLREEDHSADVQQWWRNLEECEKDEIKAIPNFDKEIFKEITGIEVE